MTITAKTPGAISYSGAGATSMTCAIPACVANDILVLVTGTKGAYYAGYIWPLDGWTRVCEQRGYVYFGADPTADTGDCTVQQSYIVVPAGGLTGSVTLTLYASNMSWAQILCFSCTAGAWEVVGGSGADVIVSTTNWGPLWDVPTFLENIACCVNDIKANDMLVCGYCVPSDAGTPALLSAETYVNTGCSFGTSVETGEPDSSTGLDIGGVIFYTPIAAGASNSSLTGSALTSVTLNNKGPAVVTRLREKQYKIRLVQHWKSSSPVLADTLTVVYPGNLVANQKLVMTVHVKPSVANVHTIYTPNGWTRVASKTGGGYGTALTTTTGNTFIYVFERVVPSWGLSGSFAISSSGTSAAVAICHVFSTTFAMWDTTAVSLQEITDPVVGAKVLSFSNTAGANTNDAFLIASATPQDDLGYPLNLQKVTAGTLTTALLEQATIGVGQCFINNLYDFYLSTNLSILARSSYFFVAANTGAGDYTGAVDYNFNHSYTAAGPYVLIRVRGTDTIVNNKTYLPSGGFLVGGSTARQKIISRVMVGAILVNGTWTSNKAVTRNSSGGIEVGGSSITQKLMSFLTRGAALVGGGAFFDIVKRYSWIMQGGFLTGGNATATKKNNMFAAGGYVIGGHSQATRLSVVLAKAGILISGLCSFFKASTKSVSVGGPIVSGTSIRTRNRVLNSIGAIIASGKTLMTRKVICDSTGSVITGGAAFSTKRANVAPKGGILLASMTRFSKLTIHTAGGAILISGQFTVHPGATRQAGGSIIISGKTTSFNSAERYVAGGLVLGGSAISSVSTICMTGKIDVTIDRGIVKVFVNPDKIKVEVQDV